MALDQQSNRRIRLGKRGAALRPTPDDDARSSAAAVATLCCLSLSYVNPSKGAVFRRVGTPPGRDERHDEVRTAAKWGIL